MNSTIHRLALLSAMTTLALALTTPASAQEKKDTPRSSVPAIAATAKPATQRIPFNGKIVAVDVTAKTIKVATRTFQVTSATRISKNGKPATLEEATVGEQAGGQYIKAADGKLELVSLRVGAKPDAKSAKPAVKPDKKAKAVTQ